MYCREREVRKCTEESSMYILMYISLDSVYLNLIFILAHIQKIYIYTKPRVVLKLLSCIQCLVLYIYLFLVGFSLYMIGLAQNVYLVQSCDHL